MAESYLTAASHAAGAVAEQAAARKLKNTPNCQQLMSFTHGPLSVSTVSFLVDLDRKISEHTGEPLEVASSFFYSSGSVS